MAIILLLLMYFVSCVCSLAWSEGGEVVFAMHVHEPAWEGIPFLRSSLDEMREQVRAAITETVAAVLAA